MKRFVRGLIASAAAFSAAAPLAVVAQSVDRPRLEREMEALRVQLQEKVALFLAPSDEDRAAWSGFLQQPNTGLIRLLPRERYRDKLPMAGDGAYYSFARLTHEYGHGSDVSLEQGQLTSGFAGLQLGLLVRLGDVHLEKATLDHPGIRFLAAFQPPRQEPEIRATYRELATGIEREGFTYGGRVRAEPDTTYAVRSIDYRSSDLLVAFRVVRRDADGSVILVWQKVKEFPVTAVQPRRISAR
jgi:hypothetical protein